MEADGRRCVLKEGWLTKYKRQYKYLPGSRRGKQRRYFVLLRERVDYYDADNNLKGSLLVTPNTQLQERCEEGTSVRIETEDETGVRGEWFLQAATHEEMDEWIIALFSQTKTLLKEAREIALRQDKLVSYLVKFGYEPAYAMHVVRGIGDPMHDSATEECHSWIEMHPPSSDDPTKPTRMGGDHHPVHMTTMMPHGREKLKRRQSDRILMNIGDGSFGGGGGGGGGSPMSKYAAAGGGGGTLLADDFLSARGDTDASVMVLMDMGFTKTEAVSGLLMNNDNVNAAVLWCLKNRLTTHGVMKDEADDGAAATAAAAAADDDDDDDDDDDGGDDDNDNAAVSRRRQRRRRSSHRRNISNDMVWMERKVESLKVFAQVDDNDADVAVGAISGALVNTMQEQRRRRRAAPVVEALDLPSISEMSPEPSMLSGRSARSDDFDETSVTITTTTSSSSSTTPSVSPTNRRKGSAKRPGGNKEAKSPRTRARQARRIQRDTEEVQAARLRKAVVDEILSSEESYVRSLDVLIQEFLVPLTALSPSVLTLQQVQLMFSNVEIIAQLQHKFLDDIRQRITSFEAGTAMLMNEDDESSPVSSTNVTPAATPRRRRASGGGGGGGAKKTKSSKSSSKAPIPTIQIGELVLSYAPFFKMYIQYVNNHSKAAQFMSDVKSGNVKGMEAFTAFLAKARESPACRGLTLESFLVMPLQRVPRYKLLLQQLIKRTDARSNDLAFLQTALKKIEETANVINESLRVAESNQVLLDVQSEFSDLQDLFTTGRRFIRRGEVIVQRSGGGDGDGGGGSSSHGPTRRTSLSGDKKMWLFLFNESLIVAQRSALSGKFTTKQRLSIDRCLELTSISGQDLVGIDMDEHNQVRVVANRTRRGILDLSVVIRARNFERMEARQVVALGGSGAGGGDGGDGDGDSELDTLTVTFPDHRVRDEFIDSFVCLMNEVRQGTQQMMGDFVCHACTKECVLVQRRQCSNCRSLCHDHCSQQRMVPKNSESLEKQRVCDLCAVELARVTQQRRSRGIVKLLIKRGLIKRVRRKRKNKAEAAVRVGPTSIDSPDVKHTKSSLLRYRATMQRQQSARGARSASVWS